LPELPGQCRLDHAPGITGALRCPSWCPRFQINGISAFDVLLLRVVFWMVAGFTLSLKASGQVLLVKVCPELSGQCRLDHTPGIAGALRCPS